MEKVKMAALLVIACAVCIFAVVSCGKDDMEEARKKNIEREAMLNDMSIPPVLSDTMRDPSWSIKYWIGASENMMPGDCKTAHEYMDEGILEKTVHKRRGGSYTHNIFEYLGGCKRSAKRAVESVYPYIAKWCHYRATDARLNELCSEWEENGDSYISTLEAQYTATETRFRQMTGSAYEDELRNL